LILHFRFNSELDTLETPIVIPAWF